MSLSREEMARAKFTFSIYDFEGTNKIDAMQLGNALRALGLFPTLKRISNLGGTIQRNEKMLSVDEFLAIYQDAKKDKEEGTLEDYMEALSSHDKDRSGRLEAKTLAHLLQGYGKEPLDRLECEEAINDCGDPDPDDGTIDYKKFLKNLMKGPEIKIPIAMLRATEDGDDSGLEVSRRGSVDDTAAAATSANVPSRNRASIRNKDEKVTPAASQKSSRKSSKATEEDNLETEQRKPGTKAEPKQEMNDDDNKSKVEEKTVVPEKQNVKDAENEKKNETPKIKKSSIRRSQKGEGASGEENGEVAAPPSEQEKGKLSVPSSARSSRKGGSKSQGQGDSASENDVSIAKDRSASPENDDDVSASSETYQADISSRNSMKSSTGRSQGGNEDGREASPADAEEISSIDGGGLSRKASTRKSGGSSKSKKISAADLSVASEEGSDLTGARSSLKSEKSRKSTEKKKKKDEAPEVKTKNQQPIISRKTANLFGGNK